MSDTGHRQPLGLQTETFDLLVGTRGGRFFWYLTNRPKLAIFLCLVIVATSAFYLPKLQKDTTADAFMPADHPAIQNRDKVKDIFGLSDPVIVALVNEGQLGVFNPRSLNLLRFLTEEIRAMDGVDPDGITSLATESNIVGSDAGMEVEPFLEERVLTQEEADEIRENALNIPMYSGSLIAEDGSATIIVVELLDKSMGGDVYDAIQEMSGRLPLNEDQIFVAGQGAVDKQLESYIDSDSMRLYPLVTLVIVILLVVSYRSIRGVCIPFIVVLGAVFVAMGSMAAFGVPIYIITNALPVILVAVGVADGIHILGQYYEEMAVRPYASQRELVVRTMTEIWGAVFYTSITDAAGFIALGFAAFMPPMRAFGFFAAIGVMAACLFSLCCIPAILVLLPKKESSAFKARAGAKQRGNADVFGRFMRWVGESVVARPHIVLGLFAFTAVVGLFGAFRLQVNGEPISYFQEDEAIYQADRMMNARFDGTNFLDVVVETTEPEGLMNAEFLQAMEELQNQALTLPHVTSATSIVDYLKQMNQAMNPEDETTYALPDDPDLIAQYFLLYSLTGDPTDFEEEIDYDYQVANIRIALNTGVHSDISYVIEHIKPYIENKFNRPGLSAHVAGQANLIYHQIGELARSHFVGVAMALLAVWLMASLSFRSLAAGSMAIVPVILSLLTIYAFMGLTNMWLDIGTSMFAAIAVGISVNFAIHTLSRAIEITQYYHADFKVAIVSLFESTGRALLFNSACLFFGFSVLLTSQIPPVFRFGMLVMAAVLISFLASMTALPAMFMIFRPRFLQSDLLRVLEAREEGEEGIIQTENE